MDTGVRRLLQLDMEVILKREEVGMKCVKLAVSGRLSLAWLDGWMGCSYVGILQALVTSRNRIAGD